MTFPHKRNLSRNSRRQYDLQTLMGSERQRALQSVNNRKLQEARENEENGRGLLQCLRRCSEIKVLVHSVNIPLLPEPLRGELLAECARLGFEYADMLTLE